MQAHLCIFLQAQFGRREARRLWLFIDARYPGREGQWHILREYRHNHRLEKHAEEYGLRRRFWTVLSVRIRGCDYRQRETSRHPGGNGAGLLQVFRRRMYFRGGSGHVRFHDGGGHYYRGKL